MNEIRTAWQKLHGAADTALSFVENIAAAIAGVIAIVMMLLTTADALMRYLLNAPLVFQFYLTSNYLLVATLMLSLAWGFRTGGYIRVSILFSRLGELLGSAVLRVGLLFSAGYLALLTWTSGKYFLKAYESNLIAVEEINWPVAWSWLWVPIGCGLLTLRVLLVALGDSSQLDLQHQPEEEL